MLRFLNQEDIVVIPKILNPKHMVENLALFDFELDSADLHVLEELDRKQASMAGRNPCRKIITNSVSGNVVTDHVAVFLW